MPQPPRDGWGMDALDASLWACFLDASLWACFLVGLLLLLWACCFFCGQPPSLEGQLFAFLWALSAMLAAFLRPLAPATEGVTQRWGRACPSHRTLKAGFLPWPPLFLPSRPPFERPPCRPWRSPGGGLEGGVEGGLLLRGEVIAALALHLHCDGINYKLIEMS